MCDYDCVGFDPASSSFIQYNRIEMSKHIIKGLLNDLNDWVDGYDEAFVHEFDYEEYNAKRLSKLEDYEFAVVWDIEYGTILELGEDCVI